MFTEVEVCEFFNIKILGSFTPIKITIKLTIVIIIFACPPAENYFFLLTHNKQFCPLPLFLGETCLETIIILHFCVAARLEAQKWFFSHLSKAHISFSPCSNESAKCNVCNGLFHVWMDSMWIFSWFNHEMKSRKLVPRPPLALSMICRLDVDL